jgi:hypothetical protein
MADEHESAVAAWLDDPDTRRELQIIGDRFPRWDEYQRTTFCLLMEMMIALNVYGGPAEDVTVIDTTVDPDELLGLLDPDDDDEGEGWKRGDR